MIAEFLTCYHVKHRSSKQTLGISCRTIRVRRDDVLLKCYIVKDFEVASITVIVYWGCSDPAIVKPLQEYSIW